MAVAFLGVSNAAGHAQNNATLGLTFAKTCDPTATLLVVEATFSDTDTGVSLGATYNGVAMTSVPGSIKHANNSTYGFTQVFYMLAPPTGAAYNVVITATGAASYNRILAAALDYSGADAPTGFVTSAGSGTSITASVTVAAGEVGCHFGSAERTIATSESHTERWALNNSSFSGNANAKHQETTSTGGVSFTLTCTSGPWASVGYVIPASGGGGGGTFIANTGDTPAAGALTTFTGAATFTASPGDADADGTAAALTGAATFTSAAADATADGATTTFTTAATFTTTATDATADGTTATFAASATFTTDTGNAHSDGTTVTFTAGATFTTNAGDATAAGGLSYFLTPLPEVPVPARILDAAGRIPTLTATGRTATLDGTPRIPQLTGAPR